MIRKRRFETICDPAKKTAQHPLFQGGTITYLLVFSDIKGEVAICIQASYLRRMTFQIIQILRLEIGANTRVNTRIFCPYFQYIFLL